MTTDDVADIVDMLVSTGKAVPAVKWVDGLSDEMFNRESAAQLAGFAL